jgi:hypothetical protein
MTTTKLPRDARLNVVLFSAGNSGVEPKFRFEKRTSSIEGSDEEIKVLIVEDLAVFRSGTFRDSMGYQHNWEGLHIDQMVQHFDLLRSRSIMPDVPVRAGHPGFLTNSLKEVIGNHHSLKSEKRTNPVDGLEYDYLLATFEVTDPGAMDSISRGTWRNVSAEVGGWTSNNETEFWPVYQGVAYVDFSAVEGLRGFSTHNGIGKQFSLMLDSDNKEAPVSGEDTKKNETTPPSSGETPPAQSPGDVAYHGRANFTFTIGGQPTNDFAAVQAHIATLEGAADETKSANRKAFIKNLSEGSAPKIMASAIESIESFALKMDDISWAAFQKSYETAPALAAVSQHATGQVNQGGSTPIGSTSVGPTDLETAAAIVRQHKISGMSKEKIQLTGSYKKLVAADANHPALAGI